MVCVQDFEGTCTFIKFRFSRENSIQFSWPKQTALVIRNIEAKICYSMLNPSYQFLTILGMEVLTQLLGWKLSQVVSRAVS